MSGREFAGDPGPGRPGEPRHGLLHAHQLLAMTAQLEPGVVAEGDEVELFDGQGPAYKNRVLPAKIGKRLAIEAGVPIGWERYVGPKGAIMSVDRFGASAPARAGACARCSACGRPRAARSSTSRH